MRQTIEKLAILLGFLIAAFSEWRAEVWRRDLDALYCCNGRECGCRAVTVREVFSQRAK